MGSAAIVLCGGRSTRMGRAKAWLPWGGQPMIAHVVESLRKGGAFDEVVVVSSAALELPPLDATTVCDRHPALGPLAGIREGLGHMRAERAFVTSTDAPFLSFRFVSAMLTYGDAAAPEVDGYVQTLAAVYPRRALPFANALLADGVDGRNRRPLHLLEAVDYCKVPAEALPDIDSIRGFNTPDEYLAAAAQSDPGATALLELRGGARQTCARSEWEIPVGTLAHALAQLPEMKWLDDALQLDPGFNILLASGESIRDGATPIGPGEHVVVTDAGT